MDTSSTPPPLPSEIPPPASADKKRPGVLLIAATVLVGLIALALGIVVSGLGPRGADPAYRLGHVIGGMVVFPLVIIALFSIGRRFRNSRSQTIILLVVWLLGSIGHLSNIAKLAGGSGPSQRESAQAFVDMERKIRDLQRQAATASISERMQLARQSRQAMEDALPKLAPKDRAGLLVAIRLVNPIIEDGGAFAQELSAFQESPEWNFSTAASQEDIRGRISRIDRLAATSIALHQRMTTLETDATRLLKDEPLDPQMKAGMLKGIKDSADRKFAMLATIQRTQQRSFEKYKEALQLLHAQWGHWQGKDGVVIWDTQANLDEFNKIVTAMQALDGEITALQKRFYLEQQ